MKVQVNGVERELAEDTTVDVVLTELSAPSGGVAVALNGEVVPRARWDSTRLYEGAVVDVLTATQGG